MRVRGEAHPVKDARLPSPHTQQTLLASSTDTMCAPTFGHFRKGAQMYKTFVVDYSPRAEKMALLIEKEANEVEKLGYEVISVSVTNSAKAVILARAATGRREE